MNATGAMLNVFSDEECAEGAGGEIFEESEEEFEAAAAETPANSKANVSAAESKKTNPLLASANIFDSLTSLKSGASVAAAANEAPKNAFSMEKMAVLLKEMVTAASNVPASIGSNSKTVTITMRGMMSLNQLANDQRGIGLRLMCQNPNLATLIGYEEAPVREIAILGYSNHLPVSLGIHAEHWRGTKYNTHITDTGMYMAELRANTDSTFSPPLRVFKCQDSPFKSQVSTHFPNVKESDIGTGVVSFGAAHPGFKFVPEDNIVMVGIKAEIANAKKLLAEKGEKYSGPEAEYIPQLKMFKVSTELATAATNVLCKSFAETNDRISVAKDFYFQAVRSCVSAKTMEASKSKLAESAWLDPHELKYSLKSGHTIQNQCEKVAQVCITIAVTLPNDV